ncbi:NADH:flavin oxidoreductase/NADH oxidase [Amycolatopsis methanolica 239]|uniref:NADH:flavin oxidoreductase/NADH oxidase n=1 Tax=Amycolatopsis methanolica 239 TaxID=1068978 RepID=A0A076N1N1_AMYME|nr:NADH:flavin oxidoreductase/NADH oxidase [Amycolatopsis methanolica 239]
MSRLFTSLTLRELTVPNRVWLSPMCQCSAGADGVPGDWHLVHLGARAAGGFGMLITESTAVSPEARISARDTGLWSDAQVAGWRRITGFAHAQGMPIAVQLGHAGRKASAFAPGEGRGTVPAGEGGWTPLAPSPSPAAASRPRRKRRNPTWPGSWRTSPRRPGGRWTRGSTRSRSTPATGTCCTSSCRRGRTGAPTATAAGSATGCGCCWR